MKCKVLFSFPIGFDIPAPSDCVFVDFPALPRRGDHINPEDGDFAPLFKKINDYFGALEHVRVENIALNVVKYITYQNFKPIVVVGNDPDKLVMFGAIPNGEEIILTSTRDLPRIGDRICGREWIVNSVNILNYETIQVGLIDGQDDSSD